MQRSSTLLRGVTGKRRATTQTASRWFGAPCSSQQMTLDRGHRVPVLLVEIRNALEECEGFATEGIFRLAAEGARQRFVRERLEAGEEPGQVLCGCQVEVLAGLLKEWLRELPDGLWASVGTEAREEFERALSGSGTTNVALLLKQAMPPAQREVFLWVLDLLADAAAHESSSKMGVEQLSAVFAPALLGRSASQDAVVESSGSGGRRGTKAAAVAELSPLEQLQAAKTAVMLCRKLLEGHVRARAPSAASSSAASAASAAAAAPGPLTRSGSKRAAANTPDTRSTMRKKAPPPGYPPGKSPPPGNPPGTLPPGYPPTSNSAAAAAANGSTGLTKYMQDEHLDWD